MKRNNTRPKTSEPDPLEGQTVLVTGGTGSFGQAFVRAALAQCRPRKVIVYSRDELKQSEMAKEFAGHEAVRFFLGDVRDAERLRRAMADVDIVVHAAALKQVPACEYNPIEAVRTNVHGAENVINAAIDCGVKKVLALSTDKAVNPVNLYGATKLAAEKLFIHGNVYSGRAGTRFSCVRYGNVVGSRGSVIPLFESQRASGKVTVTDQRMTRFWITLEQGVQFVISSIARMEGGEVFVPRIPSMKIMDIVAAVAPGCKVDTIGIRPGEKLHEVLVSPDEARFTIALEDRFLILPAYRTGKPDSRLAAKALPDGFTYSSDSNDRWLSPSQLNELMGAPRAEIVV